MTDLISRADAIEAVCRTRCGDKAKGCPAHSCLVIEEFDALPSAELPKGELISRADAIELCGEAQGRASTKSELKGISRIWQGLLKLPSADAVHRWNNHEVASILAELFGDTCACNYNGIDEWLPLVCDLKDSCPNTVGVACWEQFLKHYGERGDHD